MKKILTLMIAAAMMIGFTACEKDDNGKDLPNILQIGDKTYELSTACFYSKPNTNSEKSSNQQIYRYNIFLTDKVYWDNEGMWANNESTYANAVEVNLYYLYGAGTLTTMPDGKYVYPTTGEESLSHTGYSDYLLCDETGDGNWITYGQDYVENSNLEIEIKHITGEVYEIKFTGGIDESGKPVSGYYKGKIDMFTDNY